MHIITDRGDAHAIGLETKPGLTSYLAQCVIPRFIGELNARCCGGILHSM